MGFLSVSAAARVSRTGSRLAAMPRIRILFMIDYLVDSGGAERFALGLATSLPRDRFELWMCSTRSVEPETAAALAQAGIKQLHLGRRSRWDVHRFAKLVALVRRERFDIIHSHMFGSNVWGSLIGRLCGVPVIIAHEHTWSYVGHPLRKLIDGHLIGRLATRFVAVSSFDAERMGSDPARVSGKTQRAPSRGGRRHHLRAIRLQSPLRQTRDHRQRGVQVEA